jgi:signal transduction histidine kinase
LPASAKDSKDAAEAALVAADQQIAYEQQQGNVEKEGQARWQKIVTLKNFSLTEMQAAEAKVQMEWFRKHGQWDYYYRTWQLRANALCALGKLQAALHETQQMLDDAKERDNKLGRAMAYKQIGVIYLNMKQTEPAIEALRHYAELMQDEKGDYASLSNIYYRMAKAYDYDKAFDKELQVTQEWFGFIKEKAAKDPEARTQEYYNSCYLARAAAYIGLENYAQARQALDAAADYARQNNTALGLHHYYKMEARYYLAIGDASKALLYTDSVHLMTSERDDHTEEVRAQALIMLGKGIEAARIYQQLYYEKDSVFGRDARQHLDELNTLFQVDELKTAQQRTKFIYTVVAALTIMLALLILLLFGWRSAIRQKKANEQLRIANERAAASSKMKTEFIRNISHEIRTPLNIVSGFTQVLTSPDMDLTEEEKKDMQERMAENADRITKLVDRMLALSDACSETVIDRRDKTNVRDLASQAIGHSKITAHTRPGNSEATVTFEVEEMEPVTLCTSRLYAVRALAHLLENAVKFTPQGTIRLLAECTDRSVRFIVEDTGIGIPVSESDNIFGEFVQLDSFADGTGIGLTVARSIARRMGGDLWLDTEYVKGARFVFELLRD